jgi:hypothetical protein
VHAEHVRPPDLEPGPGIGLDAAGLDHLAELVDDEGGIDRLGIAGDDQLAVAVIGAVGGELGDDADAPAARHGGRRPLVLADPGHPGIDGEDRIGEGLGEVVAGQHGVHDAVRLDVLAAAALGLDQRRHRAELIDDQIAELRRRDVHHPAPEAHQVGEGRMGAAGDAVGDGEARRPADGARIAAMEAAGDVGRGHQRHDEIVLADREAAIGFAAVAVDAELHASPVGATGRRCSLSTGCYAGARPSMRR